MLMCLTQHLTKGLIRFRVRTNIPCHLIGELLHTYTLSLLQKTDFVSMSGFIVAHKSKRVANFLF
jgi:hypothetical protein